jgi:antitoxin component YwqK of YwqJK toxin-antitoxin module
LPKTKSGDRSVETGVRECVDYHVDGTVRARGQTRDGVLDGYWEWFRKDGTKLRSGHFENGQQTGAWTTYDRNGAPYKTTVMKPKSPAAQANRRSKTGGAT